MTGALIVGCGRIAGGSPEPSNAIVNHVLAWRAAGVPVVGCVDVDATRAARFAAEWEIARHGGDLATLLAESAPRYVSDCTPAHARGAVVKTALAATSVRVVWAEKPLGDDGATARALVAQARAAGKTLLVGYQRAYDPGYRAVGALLAGGALGPVERVTAIAYGGALTNMSHLLERALDWFGPVIEAESIAPPREADPGDPALSFRVLFARGVEGLFLPVSRSGPGIVELDVIGRAGRLRLIDHEARVERYYATADGVGGLSLSPAEPGLALTPAVLAPVALAACTAANGPAELALAERAAECVTLIEALRRTGRYQGREAA